MSILQTRLRKASLSSRRTTFNTANFSISPRYYRPLDRPSIDFKNFKQPLSGQNKHKNVLKTVLKNSKNRKKQVTIINQPQLTTRTPQKKSFEPGTYTPLGTDSGKKYYHRNPVYETPEDEHEHEVRDTINFMDFDLKENMNTQNLQARDQMKQSEANMKETVFGNHPFGFKFTQQKTKQKQYLSRINRIKKPQSNPNLVLQSRILDDSDEYKTKSYVLLDRYSPINNRTGNHTELNLATDSDVVSHHGKFPEIQKTQAQLLEEIRALKEENSELDQDIEMIKHPQYSIFILQNTKKVQLQIKEQKSKYLALEKENKSNVSKLAKKYKAQSFRELKHRKMCMNHKGLSLEVQQNKIMKKLYMSEMESMQKLFLRKCNELKDRSQAYVKSEVGMLDTLVGNCSQVVKRLLIDQIAEETKKLKFHGRSSSKM